MEREQFTFFRSFLEGISIIKDKKARCDAYDAIVWYAMNGVEPDLTTLSDAAAIAFVMARPNIDASRKRAEAGRKGGSVSYINPEKQTGSKPEANVKPAEAIVNQYKEEDKEEDKEEGQKSIIESPTALPDGSADGRSKKATIFRPPTLDEVAEYCAERHNNVDPQRFLDFYASKGWMIGKNRMKDWRAAIRTWEKRDDGITPTTGAGGFLGIVEGMIGGDVNDNRGNGDNPDLSGNLIPAELSWPV